MPLSQKIVVFGINGVSLVGPGGPGFGYKTGKTQKRERNVLFEIFSTLFLHYKKESLAFIT